MACESIQLNTCLETQRSGQDQAIELENQDALEGIERTEIREIHQIEAALKRISEGTYGACAKCGESIDPRRLKALPTAATCISCSA